MKFDLKHYQHGRHKTKVGRIEAEQKFKVSSKEVKKIGLIGWIRKKLNYD